LRDSEAFHEASRALEHIGLVFSKKVSSGLAGYRGAIIELAGSYGAEANALFEVVREARNSAVHDGASARNGSVCLVELILLLEAAIVEKMTRAKHIMVRNPVIAETWHQVHQVRRTMLTNSFSALPVMVTSGGKEVWMLVSDVDLVKYLSKATDKKAKDVLKTKTLDEAMRSGGFGVRAECCSADTLLPEVVKIVGRFPVLVTEGDRMLGLISAFDLL